MAYRGKRYNVLEAINILLESNNDSGDNSLARTVKVYKHLYLFLLFLQQVFRYSFAPVTNSQKCK